MGVDRGRGDPAMPPLGLLGQPVRLARLDSQPPTEASGFLLRDHHEEVVLVEEGLSHELPALAAKVGDDQFLGRDICTGHRRVGDIP